MADKGGRGIWTPPFLADIICEQSLIREILSMFSLQWRLYKGVCLLYGIKLKVNLNTHEMED